MRKFSLILILASFAVFSYPMKVVSMAPNITEMIYYFGMEDSLIGVTENCNYPEAASEKARVGSFIGINQERLLMLKPDLVIFSSNLTAQDKSFLENYKIAFIDIEMEDIDGVRKGAESLADILGCARKYELFSAYLDSLRAFYKGKIEGERVYVEISNRPVICCGEKSYSGSIIREMGGEVPKSVNTSPYIVISQEDVIKFNPTVIIAADFDMLISSRVGWGSTDAAKSGRVEVLSQRETDILSRPGPRINEVFEMIYRISHEESR